MMPIFRRSSTWSVVGLSCATVLVVLLASKLRGAREDYRSLRERDHFLARGMYVPRLDLELIGGGKAVIGAPMTGTRQILFLYNTTCDFCAANLPTWQALARRARSLQVEVFGLSLDSASVTQGFITGHGLAFPSALLTDRRSVGLLRASSVPQTLVVDSDGRILYSQPGLLTDGAADSVAAAATVTRSREGPLTP